MLSKVQFKTSTTPNSHYLSPYSPNIFSSFLVCSVPIPNVTRKQKGPKSRGGDPGFDSEHHLITSAHGASPSSITTHTIISTLHQQIQHRWQAQPGSRASRPDPGHGRRIARNTRRITRGVSDEQRDALADFETFQRRQKATRIGA